MLLLLLLPLQAEQGKKIVQKLLQTNDNSIKAFEQISIGIKEILTKIGDIGERGKGFAVVASEVRKLAEQSNFAAKQIQDMIAGIEKVTVKITTVHSQ